jgi:GNAT superfamily N-acetyltransferase
VITVRRSTPADSLPVATVHVRSWQRAFVGVFPQAVLDRLDPVTRAASYARGASPETFTFVAESDGSIIGFASGGPERSTATTEPNNETNGEVYAIYVDPDHWSTGAGRGLMDAAIAEMRNRNRTGVVLWTAQDTPQSHRFYERYGFRRDGATDTFTVAAGTANETTIAVVRFVLPLI